MEAYRNYLSILEQKVPHHLHEPFSLLQLRHMGRVGKLNPSDFGNVSEIRFNDNVMCFVVTPVQKQRRDVDFVEVIDNAPSFERADDVEFVWTIPSRVSEVRT